MLLAMITVATNGCAALQPSNANGPGGNLPPYPIVGSEPEQLDAARIAWQQLAQRYGLPAENPANINPMTGTIQTLPSQSGSIFLPKVGDVTPQTEEQTRESLRRFIVEWRNLIGADPNQLSLVERVDESSGVKIARYEQKPFRIPLRGGFGKLEIRFQSDRRVVGMSSTCIRNTDRLQAALVALVPPKVTADKVPAVLKDRSITARDATGQERTFTLSSNTPIEVHQLVVYLVPSLDQQTLQVRLAWEIDVTNGPIKTIYLDAVNEQVFAIT